MAYVPQVAFAAALSKHIIVCGDFKQLPPIASARDSLVKLWLKEDIFHRAGVAQSVEEGELHPHLFLLKNSAGCIRIFQHSLIVSSITIL